MNRDNLVKCIFCKTVSKESDWEIEEEQCETCTSHTYRLCPYCGDGDEGYPWEDVAEKPKIERPEPLDFNQRDQGQKEE